MPLVLSPGLVLTPPDDYGAHYPIIGWHNVVTTANITADHEDADYPITNVANPATNTRWEGDADVATVVTVTATAEIDYVGVHGHNWSGATVKVETLAPDVGASYEEQIETIPGSNEDLILRIDLQNVVGIKITVTPPSGTNPKAAVIKIGKLTTMQKGLQFGHTPIVLGQDVEMLVGVSQGGDNLGSIVTFEGRSAPAAFRNIDPDWYRDSFRDVIAALNRGEPFFWAWNPRDHDDEVGYCWLTAAARPVINHTSGRFDLAVSMAGIAP